MTCSEAINGLLSIKKECGNIKGASEAIDIAIHCIKLNEPAAPTGNRDIMLLFCPNCGRDITYKNDRVYEYCPECGQCIEWED